MLAFEAVIGVAVASSHYKYAIMLVVGVAACWLIWRFPLAAFIVGLFLAAGIIYSNFYVFRAGGRTVYGYEVVLIVLLVRAAVQPRRNTWGGAAGGVLAAFLAILLISTLMAVASGGTSLNNAINWGRPFGALAFFWVIVRLFPDRRSLGVILTSGIVLGAISGIVGLVVALGRNPSSIFQDPGTPGLSSMGGSLLRVRMPGLALGFMLLWVLLVWIARGRRPRWLWWVCLPWILVVILISQNRDMWLSGALALVLVMLVAGPRVRGRLIASLVLLVVVIAILVAAPLGGSGKTPLQPIVTRASTLLNPSKVTGSSSLTDRGTEDKYGWADAQHHLLLGIGPGVPYGDTIGIGTVGDPYAVEPRLFLQNQYLYILLITGIPGIAAFMLFLLITLRGAFIRGGPIESRLLGIGVVALMLTAIVALNYTDDSFLVALALVAGAVFALRPQVDVRRDGSTPAMLEVT